MVVVVVLGVRGFGRICWKKTVAIMEMNCGNVAIMNLQINIDNNISEETKCMFQQSKT